MNRDPRVDPQPGDRTKLHDYITYDIVGRDGDTVLVSADGKKATAWSLDEWVDASNSDTIIHVADSPLVSRSDKAAEAMTFGAYQTLALMTAIYPDTHRVTYPALGLCDEAGEVAELVKKSIRDGKPLDKDLLTKEIGDVLWYAANLAHDAGISLDDVASANIAKLKSRAERGVLGGSGDNR